MGCIYIYIIYSKERRNPWKQNQTHFLCALLGLNKDLGRHLPKIDFQEKDTAVPRRAERNPTRRWGCLGCLVSHGMLSHQDVGGTKMTPLQQRATRSFTFQADDNDGGWRSHWDSRTAAVFRHKKRGPGMVESIGFFSQNNASYSNFDFPGSWVIYWYIQYVYEYLSFFCLYNYAYIYISPLETDSERWMLKSTVGDLV